MRLRLYMLCLLQCLQQLERKLRHRASESRSDSEQISPRLLEKRRVCTLKPDALYTNDQRMYVISSRYRVVSQGRGKFRRGYPRHGSRLVAHPAFFHLEWCVSQVRIFSFPFLPLGSRKNNTVRSYALIIVSAYDIRAISTSVRIYPVFS